VEKIHLIHAERGTKIQGQVQYTDPKEWKKISVMGLNDREDELPTTKKEDGGQHAQESVWDGPY